MALSKLRNQKILNDQVIEQLSKSARDFQNIVWPRVSQLPIVGGGVIKPVEAVSGGDFADELDRLAGIDAWQVQYDPSAIRGLASRVQWGANFGSFTIRTRLPSGNETEFQKRLRAIQKTDEGHLYPHLTIQAYLDASGGNLWSAAAIKTADLINAAAWLIDNREHICPNPDHYGFVANGDGTEFLFIRWKYLVSNNLLREQDVVL